MVTTSERSHIFILNSLICDLSEVVARQDAEIARLTARVRRLMEREAEREATEGGSVPLADKPPPHW